MDIHNVAPEISKVERDPHELVGMALEIKNLEKSLEGDNIAQIAGWDSFEGGLDDLGFVPTDVEKYLLSVSQMHGSRVIVRRSKMEPVFSSLENNKSLHITRYDKEPNAAIIGPKDPMGTGESKISGIEAAMTGGFDWLVKGKVSCVFGFDTKFADIKVSDLEKDSPSKTKKYSETMKGVEGDVTPESILFFLLRIHKNFYPDDLCEEDDFDYVVDQISKKEIRVRRPFVLRLYKKNRQTH